MNEKLYEILRRHSLSLFSPIAMKNCELLRPYKLERVGFAEFDKLSVIMLAVPYLTKQEKRNISAYAVSRDYHGYFKSLFAEIIPELEKAFEGFRFAGFADDSPINERNAAAAAGLGIIGDNGMLITEKYSSYVFLGEIITDLPLETELCEIKRCNGCGACQRACPKGGGECLSAITQKKGELTEGEITLIKKCGSAWGCDICQEVCPHTAAAVKNGTIYTDIEYFKAETIPYITVSSLDEMSDEEFSRRAYSWRKRETVRRNLEILENER